MISYLDIAVPPRSVHLWRYTPWKRIHPTKVDEVPTVDEFFFSEGTDFQSSSSDEIARSFIHTVSKKSVFLELTDQITDLNIRASGHMSAGELKIKSSGNSTLIIRLSGEPGWAGLRITGEVEGQLSVVLVNDLAKDAHLLRCDDWKVSRDSKLEFSTLSSGGFLIKSDIRVDLTQPGSSCTGAIASHGHESRHDDHHVEIIHNAGHTNSTLVIHSACGGSSHSVSTGLLTIVKGADGSDAGQVFRNLLLSPKARAEAIPELEVLADDVKAAHGAASAAISPEQIHYLCSRGLSPSQASSLIVEGFLMDAFRNVKNQKVIDVIRTRLLVHLECLVKG